MSDETLSLLVDLLFIAAAVVTTIVQLARRRKPATVATPPSRLLEIVLTAAGLLVAAVGPNILVIATVPGMPEMPVLTRFALVPSLVLLIVVWITGARLHLDRLTNRIWVGIVSGAAATGLLDAVRLTGFHLGQMPGNMPRMFGVLILDQMALGPSLGSDLLGYTYHYWAGACFGLTYTLLVGRFRWWGGLLWGLLIEVGMMVTPPMVIAMDTGYFGVRFGPGLFATSLIAHIAFGAALGLMAERHLRHRGGIVALFRTYSGRNQILTLGLSNDSARRTG